MLFSGFRSVEETPKVAKKSHSESDLKTKLGTVHQKAMSKSDGVKTKSSGLFISYRTLPTVFNIVQVPNTSANQLTAKPDAIEPVVLPKLPEDANTKTPLKKKDSFLDLPFYFELQNYVPDYSSDEEKSRDELSASPTSYRTPGKLA